ncbi:MAG: MarR family transcriptional regulator [Dehalococcoidia bacterium]|nr:MarR family transcriptional regulator [Dehalococcoidia bacterium]
MAHMEANPVRSDPPRSRIDAAIADFSQALNMYDPLRFRAWAELGLTTAQLRVLFLIRGESGVTAGELASRLSVTPPTISGIVDRLVRLKLVVRETDESDRRLVRNRLTAEGMAVCSRTARGGDLFSRRIMSEMTDADLDALIRGLSAFNEASRRVAQVQPNLAAMVMP